MSIKIFTEKLYKSLFVFVLSLSILPALTSLAVSPAHGAIDVVKFDTELQETRYKSIIAELRCLVCQNQNLADSNAELAVDLKRIVHDMIKENRSDTEIMQYMTDRYGDFVLYNPPLKTTTYLLWFGPVLFMLAGLIIFLFQIKKSKNKPLK